MLMFFVIAANSGSSAKQTARVWHYLWQLRDIADVKVILPTTISSPCPLLADEVAGEVCTATGIQIPHGSAWIPLEIDLSAFLAANGDMNLAALELALHDAVDRGDASHENSGWDTDLRARDSWLNRRLAIAIRGWGCVVRRRREDPRSLATLRGLEELADFITTVLTARSQWLAKQHGHCPALDVTRKTLRTSSVEMQARWRRALADNAIRHRNLTSMSPWDVFPAHAPADLRYVDLLPLLRCANSVSFDRNIDISHWREGEFRGFYERVGAILSHGDAKGFIAKQV